MLRIFILAIMGLTLVAAVPAQAQPKGCPPGLAKKANGCQPSGLAKKQGIYHRGDRIHGDYIILRNPGRYGLNPRRDILPGRRPRVSCQSRNTRGVGPDRSGSGGS